MDWYGFKVWLETASGLNMDALHVHAGILCQLVVALLLRRSLRSPLPWLVVLAAALLNEWYDLYFETWPNRDTQYAESARDIWNTMMMPTILLLVARYAPHLLTGNRRRAASKHPDADG